MRPLKWLHDHHEQASPTGHIQHYINDADREKDEIAGAVQQLLGGDFGWFQNETTQSQTCPCGVL